MKITDPTTIEKIVKSYIKTKHSFAKPIMLVYNDFRCLDDLRHKIDKMYPFQVHTIQDKGTDEYFKSINANNESPKINIGFSYLKVDFTEEHIQYCIQEAKGLPLIYLGLKCNYPSGKVFDNEFDVYEVVNKD